MPQPIMHYYIIKHALESALKDLWKKYSNFSVFGSVFPDLMFMYGSLGPLHGRLSSQDHSNFSNMMHLEGVFDFYCGMLDDIKQINSKKSDKLKAFAYGVMSHAIADAVFHPRVYTLTGDNIGNLDPEKFSKHKDLESLMDVFAAGMHHLGFYSLDYHKQIDCHSQNSGRTLDQDVFDLVMEIFPKAYSGFFNAYGVNYGRDFKAGQSDSRHPIREAYRDFITIYRWLGKWPLPVQLIRMLPMIPLKGKVLLPRIITQIKDYGKLAEMDEPWGGNPVLPKYNTDALITFSIDDTIAVIQASEKFFESDYESSRKFFLDKIPENPFLTEHIGLDTGLPTKHTSIFLANSYPGALEQIVDNEPLVNKSALLRGTGSGRSH